jgi:acetyl-CoA carboxylase carboxyltransferase component
MVWQKEVDEIGHRRRLVEKGGIPERIERQRAQGKLTVRERIAALADPGSFEEIGGLGGAETYDGDRLVSVMPPGKLMGWCRLNGRKVLVSGDDSTVRYDMPAGRAELATLRRRMQAYGEVMATHHRLPYIRLLDAPGASVRIYERTARPEFVSTNQWVDASASLLSTAPLVSLVVGSIAGQPGVETCLCHFNVIVRGTGHTFPGGPPVVKAALGYDIHKEDLGGADISSRTGVVDMVAETEEEAFSLTRRFLSYLPDNVWEMPPRAEPGDDPNRRDEELLSAVPRDSERRYNPHEILEHVLDRDSLFEIAPMCGQSLITALGRANGYPVGVVIRNPASPSLGAMDALAADKVVRLLRLCDTFHLPVVCFVDELGFMVGPDSEKQGIVRASARMVQSIYASRMAWIAFIIGRAYGVAGCMVFRPYGMSKSYAWPSANWRAASGQTLPLYQASEAYGVESIIDPRETRPLLCDFVETAQKGVATQLGPSAGPIYWP